MANIDYEKILDVIVKGLSVVNTLRLRGKSTKNALKVVTDLATGAKTGEVTDAELEATETLLDSMIDDFNKPMD
jgi:hypothetical protein